MKDEFIPEWMSMGEATGPPIRRVPIQGDGIHLAGHPHSAAGFDYIKEGAATLGPIAYSLLRAEVTTLADHRRNRGGAIADRLRDVRAHAEKLRPLDELGARKFYRQTARLHAWDLVGLVYETCEHLACLFDSIRGYRDGRITDLGMAMLDFKTPAFDVLASPNFTDLPWWRTELGIVPDKARFALLTVGQKALLIELFNSAEARLPEAVALVQATYTRDLHRLAIRRRHAVSLLDAEFGLAWLSTGSGQAEADLEALQAGGLAVADTDGKDRPAVELLLPLSATTINSLFQCLMQAHWLVLQLAVSAVGRAENPAHVAIAMDPDAPKPAHWNEIAGLIPAYIGSDPADLHRFVSEAQRIADVVARARPGEPRDQESATPERSR